VETVEAVLRAPGDLEDVVGLTDLPVGQRGTDPGLAQVVPGGLDEEAAGEAGAGLGDRTARLARAGLVQRGDESEPSRQLAGSLEAAEVADLEMQHERRERLDAAEAAQPGDGRPVLRLGRRSLYDGVILEGARFDGFSQVDDWVPQRLVTATGPNPLPR
jgi:hypothetical protein